MTAAAPGWTGLNRRRVRIFGRSASSLGLSTSSLRAISDRAWPIASSTAAVASPNASVSPVVVMTRTACSRASTASISAIKNAVVCPASVVSPTFTPPATR